MHSSGFFQIKLIARLILKREISGSHTISDQSLLLSTIVLNDMLSKNTWGVKSAVPIRSNIANRQVRPNGLISAEAKKLFYQMTYNVIASIFSQV